MKKEPLNKWALQINFLLIAMKYSVVVSLCNMAAMQTLTLFASLKNHFQIIYLWPDSSVMCN